MSWHVPSSVAPQLHQFSPAQRMVATANHVLGVLMVVAENDPDAKRFVAALENQLDAEGWHKGRTYRWGASNPERLTHYSNELVLAAPDILVTLGTAALPPMQKATTTIPDFVIGKACRVLGHTELFEPVRNLLHRRPPDNFVFRWVLVRR